MSETDSKRLLGSTPVPDEATGETAGNAGNSEPSTYEKNQKAIWGGAAALLVIIIIIIVATTGGGDDPVPPGPTPEPIVPDWSINPYYLDMKSYSGDKSFQTGTLKFNKTRYSPDQIHAHIAKVLNEDFSGVEGSLNFTIDPQAIPTGLNNNITENVTFHISQVDFTTTRIWFGNQDWKKVYHPPVEAVNTKTARDGNTLESMGFELYANPFEFELRSTRTENDTLVNMKESDFVVTDRYLQLDLQVATQRIYGFGERHRQYTLNRGTWTMWANGQDSKMDNGQGGLQTYGVHPFALVQSELDGEFFGLYFRNTNAASPVIRHKSSNGTHQDVGSTISYITTGGEIELFVFTKGTAAGIIKQYHNLIGKPSLPPFWALGWQATAQASADTGLTLADVKSMQASYKQQGIPLEGIWLDASYMDNYSSFTVDSTKFAGLSGFADTLHADGQKLVVLVGPSIPKDAANKYYSQAVAKKALIESSLEEGGLVSKVFPSGGEQVFLDWFSADAATIWNTGLTDLYAQTKFDGLWLDLNEATGVCAGECSGTSSPIQEKDDEKFFYMDAATNTFINNTWNSAWSSQTEVSTYFLPFIPGSKNLDATTLSLNATHPSNGLSEYNVHNLFGHLEGKITQEFLLNDATVPSALKGLRTFIMSRSTFSGSGAHVAHGLGKEQRTWDDMALGIAGVMNFQMFGIPLSGPNACGYYGATIDDELCGRWIQLASMFPLARQDRAPGAEGGPANHPYLLKQPYNVWAKNAIINRYQFIRQIYTCLFRVSQEGGTCVDPLLMHYPDDKYTFDPLNTENSFILADALKVVPVLNPMPAGKTEMNVRTYFPKGEWVNMADFSDIRGHLLNGAWIEVPAPVAATENILTYLKPGSMTSFQPNNGAYTTTDEVLKNAKLNLIANIDPNGWATGSLFLNKGDEIVEVTNEEYEYYQFHLSAGSLKKWNLNDNNRYPQGHGLDSLTIVNAETHANTDFACWVSNDETVSAVDYKYDAATKSIVFNDPTGPIDLTKLRYLYYGNTTLDQNLCVGILGHEKQFYKLKEGELPDFSGTAPVTLQLENNMPLAHPELNITITLTEADIVNIRWNYANKPEPVKTPYEIPSNIIDIDLHPGHLPLSDYVQWHTSTGGPDKGEFFLSVVNPKTQQQIWTLRSNMQLNQHLNMWEGRVHTNTKNFQGVMGLSDQVGTDLFLGNGTYSLWTKDSPDPVETGKFPAPTTYGAHPFIMGAGQDGEWFGLYSNVANAQDWVIHNEESDGSVVINMLASGGRGDLSIWVGETPNDVVQTYHQRIVGLPVVTPQWALGWHQSKWGYKDTQYLKQVVDEYETAQLPLDGIWSDIDYMEDYKDFIVDQELFGDLKEFVANLTHIHYIPIVDAGIAQRIKSVGGKTPYLPYIHGHLDNLFIKSHAFSNDSFTGRVWPGDVVYPDYTNPQTQHYWSGWLSYLQEQTGFDGIWLDMNEASNFCDGYCFWDQQPQHHVQRNLKYVPTGQNLETGAIALDAVHYDGSLELDAHSLYGTMETEATHNYFVETLKKRPMIIARSSFAGSGKYGSRWLGDNFSTYNYLAYSVTGVMMQNIMGIPLAGADICGFNGNTTADLCARWYTIGSFYPFSRNHNHQHSVRQAPFEFNGTFPHYPIKYAYIDIMRWAMWNKMSLIRYYYSEISQVQRTGGAFFRPLFFDYPNDGPDVYAHQVRNVMLGNSLKLGIIPDFGHSGTSHYPIYFPKGMWCEVFNRKGTEGCSYQSQGGIRLPEAQYPWDFYLHMKMGTIIPFQDQYAIKAMNTEQLQEHPVTLHILPDCWETNTNGQCVAGGIYFNDDGLTLDKTQFNMYQINYTHPEVQAGEFPKELIMKIVNKHVANPKAFHGAINANDYLGGVEIYNAAEWLMNVPYKVTATRIDGSFVFLTDAIYDKTTDRLVYTNDQHGSDNEISLAQLDQLQFDRIE